MNDEIEVCGEISPVTRDRCTRQKGHDDHHTALLPGYTYSWGFQRYAARAEPEQPMKPIGRA